MIIMVGGEEEEEAGVDNLAFLRGSLRCGVGLKVVCGVDDKRMDGGAEAELTFHCSTSLSSKLPTSNQITFICFSNFQKVSSLLSLSLPLIQNTGIDNNH